jgi:hypothetical protein
MAVTRDLMALGARIEALNSDTFRMRVTRGDRSYFPEPIDKGCEPKKNDRIDAGKIALSRVGFSPYATEICENHAMPTPNHAA